ncbi:hypothetical protein FGE12_23635 [Aggregicoccus sp. 17bor-14]|uniref:hypothetical protein n=1 Tax=Myxococcaceae TaxID=31 RepID=UPI00129C5373|nr:MULTISPECIES: hypothetical protein [Myxococcaceae]MBF5045418.1 hypothetical protein [Simulacricoccus sp. 17bor-14]MRI91159.1 hypothetical protein [Aggregicoccus sp. 17bor-14]
MLRIDLHRHLEGSHSPAALAEVARHFPIPALRDASGAPLLPPAIAEGLVMQGPGTFDDFYRCVLFARRAYASLDVVRELTRLACVEVAAEMDRCELRFGLYSMTRDYLANVGTRVETLAPVPFADVHARGVLEAVLAGRDAAERETGRRVRLRLGFSRTFESEPRYAAMADMVQEYTGALVGMDVQGKPARGFAEPLPEGLVRILERLRPQLLDLTLHAGELEGAESIEQALALRPDGLGHGVRAVESEPLMRRLAELGTTLEVCPTSNALLIGPTLAELSARHGGLHPLAVLLQHGVRCAVATDDPANFGTDLSREHALARGLGVDVAQLAANALRRWEQVGANARLADAA